jgi:hypothetical protein
MPDYRITGVITSNSSMSSKPAAHCSHVTDVMLSNGLRLTVEQVYRSMRAGSTFHAMHPAIGVRAEVAMARCECLGYTLTSHRNGRPEDSLLTQRIIG